MTATITDHLGATLTGEIKVWLGRRIVEIQTPDGARHIGRLHTDATRAPAASGTRAVGQCMSTVDGAP